MRIGITLAVAAVACAFASSSFADVKVNIRTEYYPIVGRAGSQLLLQMDRKGPKHGFLTRAIAQTRYTVNWNVTWESDKARCAVKDVDAQLNVVYNYPRVATMMTPNLRRKWHAFISGVTRHEQTHGTLARRMVAEAEKGVRGVSVANDPHCGNARAEVKRYIAAAYAKYEAKQRDFDEREHRDGGNVARLVEHLAD